MGNCNTCPSHGSCGKDAAQCGVENNPENKIHFKNVKTNIETAKDLSSVSFMTALQ